MEKAIKALDSECFKKKKEKKSYLNLKSEEKKCWKLLKILVKKKMLKI